MDMLLIFFLGVFSCHVQTSGSVSEVRVRLGDNITFYCDCKQSLGVYVVWFRNCSHGNQPTLVIQTHPNFPLYKFLKNDSSHTYDLLILNVTDSDEGFYYCGTEQIKVVDDEYIISKSVYNYGNITTKLICDSNPDCSGCSSSSVPWMVMVFTPTLIIFLSLFSFVFVLYYYNFCRKTEKNPDVFDTRLYSIEQTGQSQNEDVCLTQVVFRAKDGDKCQ
ncbi:uncharacterized protein LOC113128647 [Mastacembelus armatus]|uniref:uncharacterized protein LOC113128647 n=1 Tax=Mastacembelus armatus TaxID=205130 RepID=UPI000E462359|nr:uncharacterized protein LOC113128647 [Mastacembelus armatus]